MLRVINLLARAIHPWRRQMWWSIRRLLRRCLQGPAPRKPYCLQAFVKARLCTASQKKIQGVRALSGSPEQKMCLRRPVVKGIARQASRHQKRRHRRISIWMLLSLLQEDEILDTRPRWARKASWQPVEPARRVLPGLDAAAARPWTSSYHNS